MSNTSNGKGKRKASEVENEIDGEIWKPCHLTDLYEISDIGRVRRTENKVIRKNSINPHGYNYLTLAIKGKSYTCLVGRMVLHSFVRAPLDGEIAHHMDGNSDNDIVDNLKWTSIGEANTKRSSPSVLASRSVVATGPNDECHLFISPLEASLFIGCTRGSIYDAIRFDRKLFGYTFDYDSSEDPTCEKRKVDGWDAYTVSEDGRFKGKQGGWKFGPKHGGNGNDKPVYRKAEFVKYVDGKPIKKKWYIHVLIAETFIGKCPDGHQVDHINGDTSYNDVSNLEYVSRSENNKRAYKNGRKPPNQKSVVLIKPNGEYYKFKSYSEGGRNTGVDASTVWQNVSNERKNMAGDYWALDGPIIQNNGTGDLTHRFESLSMASTETGINILDILLACRDKNNNSWNYDK